ncbi:MAG: LPS export ABC transporter periplasmic protein LptC [Magnetococcales bacterium]|nr:LPS export ABC transporter periplasmic protein LptC [Magnetococcales bacterium]
MPRRYLKYLFLAISLMVVGGLAWHLTPQRGNVKPLLTQSVPPEKRPPAAETPGIPATLATDPPTRHHEATATGVRLVQDDGQRKKWSLTASSAEKPDVGHTLANGPRLTLFSNKGTSVTITSRQGTLDHQTREVAFVDEVYATDGQDLHLTTTLLRFDPQRRLLSTERFFHLTGKGVELSGIGLEVDQKTQQVKVLQKVKAVFSAGFRDLV